MNTRLHEVFLENRQAIEEELFLRLESLQGQDSYPAGEATLHGRVTRLVDAFLDNLAVSPRAFVAYVEKITEDRIAEGITLHQLQTILQVLEEKAWHLVVERVPLEDQVACLGMITMIIGTAKDRIANIFLHHLEQAEAAAARHHEEILGPDEVDLNCQRGSRAPHTGHGAWTGPYQA